MKATAAVQIARQRERMYDEPHLVYYDDDYHTYHVLTLDAYYQIPTIEPDHVVWSSTDGYTWTERQFQQHPG